MEMPYLITREGSDEKFLTTYDGSLNLNLPAYEAQPDGATDWAVLTSATPMIDGQPHTSAKVRVKDEYVPPVEPKDQ